MKGNELVWRVLADRAIEGKRTWANVADLAFEAGVPSTTAYLALDHSWCSRTPFGVRRSSILDAVATRLNDAMPLVALPPGPQTRYAPPQ